jgi:hypothetical protein
MPRLVYQRHTMAFQIITEIDMYSGLVNQMLKGGTDNSPVLRSRLKIAQLQERRHPSQQKTDPKCNNFKT